VTLWPTSIVIGSTTIALADVAADVTIHHGRDDPAAGPTASTCQIRVYDVAEPFVDAFHVGQTLTVSVADPPAAAAPRFTGRITDAALDENDLTVIAAGAVATLYRYQVGTVAWPVEAWSARVSRLFSEAGISSSLVLQADSKFDPPVAARDPATAGDTTVGDYLAFLAPMVGAVIVDRPDGKVLVQAIGARSLAAEAILDPADVLYSPQWTQELPPGNVVTVRYTGDQSESVTVTDSASIGIYGRREVTIDTSFTQTADATTRANQALNRGAYPHWNMRAAELVRGLVLSVGQPVELHTLPAASPYDPWTPIVEGWTDTITGDVWRMALSLSDPLASGLVITWNAVPATLLWNQVNPDTSWAEALTLEDLL